MNHKSIRILFAGDFIPPESSEDIYSDELLQVLSNKDFSIIILKMPLKDSNLFQ
jgi:hypothetical protein